MSRPRVVPVLLLDGDGLVKTARFRDPVYLGDPLNTVRIFNEKEADELVVIDISATSAKRGPDVERIRDLAAECFMPVSYGGGINSLAHAEAVLRAGVEKVIITSAATPALIAELSRAFGSQSIVVGADAVRGRDGTWQAAVQRAARPLPGSLFEHLARLCAAGAGEVILQCVERDGMGGGYDCELVREAAQAVGVPLVALGGAGSLRHLAEGLAAGASAVAAGSLFTLYGRHRAPLITYPSPAEIESLTGKARP